MKVVVSDCSWNNYDVEIETLKKEIPGVEVGTAQVQTEEDILKYCKDADAVMSEYGPYTRKVLEQLPNLKIISNSAMGVDNIDLDACKDLGIAVANVPRYCIHEVAEHIAALVLSMLRWIPGYDKSVKDQKRWEFSDAPKLYRIEGMTVGLVGCGRIATMAVNYLKGFNFKVYGYDPYLPKEVAEANGITLVDKLTDLGEVSDIVISHIPGLPGTEKMVNAEFFNSCKKHPVFVNAARGSSVDYDALAEALEKGIISQAGLDVVDTEPADFSHAIFKAPNVIFTPHAAFYSETALYECRHDSAMNVKEYLIGDKSKVNYVVDPNKK